MKYIKTADIRELITKRLANRLFKRVRVRAINKLIAMTNGIKITSAIETLGSGGLL